MPDAFGNTLLPLLSEVAEDYGSALYEVMQPYPPPTIANSPDNPKGRWYERGYGERWRRRNGSIGGRPTSGQLGDRWTRTTETLGEDEVDATVENIAQNAISGAYYPTYVQGEVEDQSRVHQSIGWKSVDTGLSETEPTLDRLLDEALDKFLEAL